MNNTKSATILGSFLAIGLIIAALVIGGAVKSFTYSNQTISVKGFAEKNIKADLAVWRCNLTVRTTDKVTGYDKVKLDLKKTLAFLASKGIDSKNITIGGVSSQPLFNNGEYGASNPAGYMLEQQLKITSSNPDLLATISTEVSSLLREGIDVQSFPPEYIFTKLNDLKISMLSQATSDAKSRAEQIAKSGNCEVGAIKSAKQGVFQIVALNSSETDDGGMFDVSSIDKTIKAVVTIEYYIK